MKNKTKICIDCGCNGTVERKRCEECLQIHNRKRVSEYNIKRKLSGKQKTRYGIIKCYVCGMDMIKGRPNQIAHGKCRKKSNFDYNKYPRDNSGRIMVGRLVLLNLGIRIPKGMCVHHIDENPNNNSLQNLMILNRRHHIQLHKFLGNEWIWNYKIHGAYLEKIWSNMLLKLNFMWIEITRKKIVEIDPNQDIESINVDNQHIYVIKRI